MRMRRAPETAIRSFFSSLQAWAVLRNADVFDNFARGGDCDLLVRDIDGAARMLVRHLGNPVRIAERSYVRSYYYEWGHIDLTDCLYWRGLCLCDAETLLARAGIREGWPVISEEDEAICLLLNSLLWGGFVKRRYLDRIGGVFGWEAETIRERLETMLGPKAAEWIISCVRRSAWEELEARVRRLRREVAWFHFRRRPFRSLLGQLRFAAFELRLRLGPQIPVLALEVDGGVERPRLKELVAEEAKRCEYHLAIVDWTGGRMNLRLGFDLLRRLSFRARNGAVVYLIDPGIPGGWLGRRFCRVEIKEVEPEVVQMGFDMIQEESRRRYA